MPYIGIFLLLKYDVLVFLPNHVEEIFEEFYLTHRWQSWFEYFYEWAFDLAESNFFIALLGFLPIIAITVLLIVFEALLVFLKGLIKVVYGIAFGIIAYVLYLGLFWLVPPAIAVGSIILMIVKRVNADDEYILQTILCVLGSVLSAVLCVLYFVACFNFL